MAQHSSDVAIGQGTGISCISTSCDALHGAWHSAAAASTATTSATALAACAQDRHVLWNDNHASWLPSHPYRSHRRRWCTHRTPHREVSASKPPVV